MSIEKMGNMELSVNVPQKSVAHKGQKAANAQNDVVVHDAWKDLTRISYPPFLPIGDTQSIYTK